MPKASANLITTVWGEWHVDAFLSYCIPTMLSEGNLPAFVERVPGCFQSIYTKTGDAKIIEASPAYQKMCSIIPTKMVCLEDEAFAGDNLTQKIFNQAQIWTGAMNDVGSGTESADHIVSLLLPSDNVWADGAFGHLGDLVAAGKRAIFIKGARVVSETFLPEFTERYRPGADGKIIVPGRELVDISMRHFHPLWAGSQHDSPRFPYHSEIIMWPVAGEGYLFKILTSDGFGIDAEHCGINSFVGPARVVDVDEVAFSTDSDDLFYVSLTPLTKDWNWNFNNRKASCRDVAGWWAVHDSVANRILATQVFRYHRENTTVSKWREAVQNSEAFLDQVQRRMPMASLHVYLQRYRDREVASSILATLFYARMAECPRTIDEPFTALIPTDSAFKKLMPWSFEGLLHDDMTDVLWDLFFDHVVPGTGELNAYLANGSGNGGEIRVKNLSGRELVVTSDEGGPRVNGVAITGQGKTENGNLVLLVDDLLSR